MATETNSKRRILNVSLPPEMYEAVETMAQEEQRTKSELIREALRHYQFTRRWRILRRWGAETADRLEIYTDDALEQFLG